MRVAFRVPKPGPQRNWFMLHRGKKASLEHSYFALIVFWLAAQQGGKAHNRPQWDRTLSIFQRSWQVINHFPERSDTETWIKRHWLLDYKSKWKLLISHGIQRNLWSVTEHIITVSPEELPAYPSLLLLAPLQTPTVPVSCWAESEGKQVYCLY